MEEDFYIPFDEIEIEEEIGKGSFGAVYRGSYLGTEVALKRLDKSDDPYINNMAKREIENLKAMRHPNVMMTIGVTTDGNDTTYIVSEYVPKGNLRQYLRKNRNEPLIQRIKFLMDVSKAMIYLHAKDIAHRDLKTRNFLVDENLRVKLCDFGFAKRREDRFMTLCGTDSYVAPEIIVGQPYGMACDVFSYGIAILEVITGASPEKNPAFKRIKPTFGLDIYKITELFPNSTPARLKLLTVRCIEEDPSVRPTFKEILDTLKKILSSIEEAGVSSNKISSITQPNKSTTEEHKTPTLAPSQPPKRKHTAQPLGMRFALSIAPETRVAVRFKWINSVHSADSVSLVIQELGEVEWKKEELRYIAEKHEFSLTLKLRVSTYVCHYLIDGEPYSFPHTPLNSRENGIRFVVSAKFERNEAPQLRLEYLRLAEQGEAGEHPEVVEPSHIYDRSAIECFFETSGGTAIDVREQKPAHYEWDLGERPKIKMIEVGTEDAHEIHLHVSGQQERFTQMEGMMIEAKRPEGREWQSTEYDAKLQRGELKLTLRTYEVRVNMNNSFYNLLGQEIVNTKTPATYLTPSAVVNPKPPNCNFDGNIVKEGGRRKNWKKRYCVLEGHFLSYYKKKEDYPDRPLNTIDITTIHDKIQVSMDHGKPKNCFQIPTGKRMYYFSCNDTKSVLGWIQNLRLAQNHKITLWPFGL